MYFFADQVDGIPDHARLNLIRSEFHPVLGFPLYEYLIGVEVRSGKGYLLLTLLCDGKRKSHNIRFALVEFIDRLSDPGSNIDLQIDIEVLSEQLQQLIVIAHGLTFINEVANGIVVNKRVDVAPFPDTVQVDRGGWRCVSFRGGDGSLAGENRAKRDQNPQNASGSGHHSLVK